MRKFILPFILTLFIFNCSSDDDSVVVQDPFIEEDELELPVVNNEFTCECQAPEAAPPTAGDMVFEGNINLQSQSQVEAFGAKNYTYIVGNLIIGIPLSDTPTDLTDINDISSLSSIRQVNGQINVSSNPFLPSLNGLENIISTSALVIERNALLTSLDGFDSLTTIIDRNIGNPTAFLGPITANIAVFIFDNPALTSITALRNINMNCLNTVSIGSTNLTSLEGLENFRSISVLRIGDDSLISLQGLENLESACEINISGNAQLISISELSNIQNSNFVSIRNNNALTSISFAGLEAVGQIRIINNPLLNSISLLNNLQSANTVMIDNNKALISLQGLENLELATDVTISNNANLNSIEALSLQRVNSLNISSNTELASLNGLESLTEIRRSMVIVSNPLITSLDVFKSLTTQFLSTITIGDNDNLLSLEGLEDITAIQNVLTISNNDKLISLQGLENLTLVEGAIDIRSNSSLTSVETLNNIERTGILRFLSNASLTSLQGLENITEIRQALVVKDNASLSSLDGLDNIGVISGINLFDGFLIGIEIGDNDVLNDFCALQTLFINDSTINTEISDNLFNPSIQDIIDDNCNQ